MNACILKYVELVLTIACVVLHHYSYDLTDVSTLVLCSGTFVAFLIVLTGEIIGEVMGAGLEPWMDALFTIKGVVLFVASGALTLLGWSGVEGCRRRTVAVVSAALALLTALVMLTDVVATLCRPQPQPQSPEKISPAPPSPRARMERQ